MKPYPFATFYFMLGLLGTAIFWMITIHHASLSEGVFIRTLVDFKLPRILLGMVTGGLFAIAGALLQEVMKNKIASPDILGISSSSILCVIGIKFFYPELGWITLSGFALLGALLGFMITYFLAYQHGKIAIIKFILIGVALGIITKAGAQWILQHSSPELTSSLSYMVGTTYGADWTKVTYVSLFGFILFIIVLINYRSLIYFNLSDENAKSIGFNLSFARKLTILLAIACTGTAVMGIGNLGFVGLVAPNIARLICRNNKLWFLVFSALIGMTIVVMADALAQTIFYPTEVPVGVVTTIIGAPYFLWLLRKYF